MANLFIRCFYTIWVIHIFVYVDIYKRTIQSFRVGFMFLSDMKLQDMKDICSLILKRKKNATDVWFTFV